MKFNFLNKLFGSTNERKITALNPILQKINSLAKAAEVPRTPGKASAQGAGGSG